MITRFEQQGIPNPGSAQALNRGCQCAVIDNHYGRGFPYGKELCFYVTMGCPLHAPIEDAAPL